MKNKYFRTLATVAFICGLVLSIQAASASAIGTLLTGSSGTVTATATSITFNNDPAATGGSNFLCPSGSLTCDSDVSTGTTLTYLGCSGVLGSPGCLSALEGVDVNSPITPATILPENNFLTFSNNQNLVYSLVTIPTITNENCAALTAGQSCVIYPGAVLVLTLEANNTTQVTLNLTGRVSDTGVAGLAAGNPYVGSFTEPLTSLPNGMPPTPANIQLFFCGTNSAPTVAQCTSNGASITSSQSGSFTSGTVPEPSSIAMTLVGGALILVALGHRRKRSGL